MGVLHVVVVFWFVLFWLGFFPLCFKSSGVPSKFSLSKVIFLKCPPVLNFLEQETPLLELCVHWVVLISNCELSLNLIFVNCVPACI